MVSMLDYWRVTLWSILAFFPLLRPLEVGKYKMAIFALFDYRFLVTTTTTNGNQQPQDEDKQVDVGQVHRQGSG